MGNGACLNHEIVHLKELLEQTAKLHQYNFRHPKVISVSQKLDGLILKKMQEKKQTSVWQSK
jgi:hypothetical protein